MIFLILLGELLRCTAEVAVRVGNYDTHDCWRENTAVQHVCCSQEQPGCFNEEYTKERCCPTTCLPLKPYEVSVLLELSSGFDAPRLSVAALPEMCLGVGWQPIYALVRVMRLTAMPVIETAAAVAVLPEDIYYQYTVLIPLRSMLFCAPTDCWALQDLEKLVLYITERTLPAPARQSQLLEAKVLATVPLQTFGGLMSADHEAQVGPRLGPADPVIQAAKAMMSNITSGSLVVFDVGTHARSEFMEWLQGDREGRRWVVGFEPDPVAVSAHEAHSRLALLQVAVGRIPEGESRRTVLLHRSENGVCSSLFPLRSDPREFAGRVSWEEGCFAASDSGPVEVSIVPLADILALLPAGQQVALLKVDTQGGDFDVVLSAGKELQRVRRMQVEVTDLPRGHPDLVYGRSQPTKEDVINVMTKRGFLLDACCQTVKELHEENCLFVRADLLDEGPSADMSVLAAGQFRWDRPGIHFRF